MWWSRKNKKEEQRVKDAAQIQKVQESQRVLLEAATSTADAAQEVTMRLKNRLDDSVRQLESTAKLIADALIICNSDGIIDSANPAAEQSFGWKASDLKGQSISHLFRKNGLNAEPSEILDVFLEDNIIGSDKFEQPIEQLKGRRKTGELFWIDGSITQMERLDGNIIIMMLVRDVTTRMEVQRELKMNEARYRSIFEQSFDGIMIVQNYHVVAANPAISRVLGYSAESFIAKPMVNFFHKQSSKVLIDNHTACLEGDMSPRNCVATGIRSDGSAVELLVSSTLIKWGVDNASLITLKDITEIRKLENDLGNATRINNVFVNNDIDMLACFDHDFKISRVNQSFLRNFDVTESSVIGQCFLDWIPDGNHAGYQDTVNTLTAQRPTGRFQFYVMVNDVEQLQDWIVHAIFDEAGQFIEYQSLGRDITSILHDLTTARRG